MAEPIPPICIYKVLSTFALGKIPVAYPPSAPLPILDAVSGLVKLPAAPQHSSYTVYPAGITIDSSVPL